MIDQNNVISTILIIPILAGIICVFLRNYYLVKNIVITIISVIFSYVAYVSFHHQGEILRLIEYQDNFSVIFTLEPIGTIFLTLISMLWVITNIYSCGFFLISKDNNEDRNKNFLFFLSLSIFAAVIIALSGNLITIFTSYELLTIISYPLIIYYKNEAALKAGKTYLLQLMITSNFLLLPGLIFLGETSFDIIFNQNSILTQKNTNIPMFVSMMIIYGASKIAIFPFYKWLVKSMAAPTNVSGLLHSVTIVKGGIFTIIKIFVYIIGLEQTAIILKNNVFSINWLSYISSFTIIFACLNAIKQENFKKIFAYSTIAQLSQSILAFSISNKIGLISSILHILSHSFAKITLFFSVGIIKLLYNKEDYTKCKNLYKYNKLLSIIILINALSIMGIPPFFGFWTKYYIINSAFQDNNWLVIISTSIGSIFTSIYLINIIYNIFLAKEESVFSKEISYKFSHYNLYLPIILTSIISVIGEIFIPSIIQFLEQKLFL